MRVRGSQPHRLLVGCLSGAALLAVAAGSMPASASAGQASPPMVLERDMRGEQAIAALGDRLPQIAAMNAMSAPEFRAALRGEPMLWVGRSGRLLFVDDLHAGEHEAPSAEPLLDPPTADDLAAALRLHSNPNATRVVVLDFDGHDSSGTAWDTGGVTTNAAPYDTDGAPSSFSDDERAVIYSVWQRVSEDFAPFDVDVTTEDPGIDRIRRTDASDGVYGTRLVVTPSKTYECRCGGVAYVGVFDQYPGKDGDPASHDHYQPAWVFTAGVGNGAKNIAEAASHEVGHNLGLHHDGTASTGYYEGHGDWAPIMGVGYHRPITQWSKGEFAGATTKQAEPDDFLVMEGHGAPPVADDHSQASPTAADIGTTSGLVGRAGDLDRFTFTPASDGVLTVQATPAPSSPNLDLRLDVAVGTVALWADPPSSDSSGNDVSLGLDALVSLSVTAGVPVAIDVSGVGFGDPATTGYSTYGSVGRYRLSLSMGTDDGGGTDPSSTAPTAPTDLTATPITGGASLAWSDTSTDEAGFRIDRETQLSKNRWGSLTTLETGAEVEAWDDVVAAGTYRYRIRAFNAAGESASTAWVKVTVGSTSGGGGSKGGGKPTRAS